ncbi:unnamed protein product [Gongylonema pulchrum]|uniref:WD_REPEATS_REGION domain-containing protein n=1 Tax=Gongylonema pulchrum TaxID=637853 RepID=A0A183EA59_9BILA|nr:unnamed protein product [Gongylonema pulchrum]
MSNSDWPVADSNSASRQAAVKSLQDTDRAVMEAAQYLRMKKGDNAAPLASDIDSDSEDDEKNKKGRKKSSLDPETVDALGEFSFLKDEKTGATKKKAEGSGEWGVNQRAIDQMKEKFRSEQERKRSNSQSEGASVSKGSTAHQIRVGPEENKKDTPAAGADDIQQFFGGKGKREYSDINTALGIADEATVDIKDDFVLPDEDTSNVRWNLKFTLRSHFDSIRAMQFHPVEPVLVTASEDGTAKLWNLGGANIKGGQISSHCTAVTELEPTYTFRGHSGPIVSMDMSPTGDMCYTGGFDGVVCCWSVPSVNTDIYEPYDSKVLCEKLKGHSNIVWSVAFHSSDNRLVSASADTTVKLWEPGSTEPLIKTFNAPLPHLCPTSVDFVSTEPQQLLAAYTSSYASIIDLETGCTVLSFDFGEGNFAFFSDFAETVLNVRLLHVYKPQSRF